MATIPAMARALVERTSRAATGPERQEHEPLAGTGFYFRQRQPLAEETEDVGRLAEASSRLSPKTSPTSEAKTAIALVRAHQSGSVHFGPELMHALGSAAPQEHAGQTVPFRELPSHTVDALRKKAIHDVASRHVSGVDLEGLRSVGLGGNVRRAHETLQGTRSLSPFKNPKQFGYAQSIEQATPGPVEDEYMFRASHLGKVLRGEIHRGQQALDTGLMGSNEGMLSNTAPIAADTWTRRASSGQDLSVAGAVADTFISAKGDVGKGDTTITPVGIEHAQQQEAVERAAQALQEQHATPFTIPSRLIQETGGWAQPRREAGEDPQFNAAQREQEQEQAQEHPRNLSSQQFKGQGTLF